MFFYIEQTPIMLSTNVGSLTFSNIAVNSSSSLTFTVNSTGNTTETITLSDDSDQFEFSPTSFELNGGESQTITANFKPTVSGPNKTGMVTISASGGSIVNLALTGTATSYIRFAVNNPTAAYSYGSAKAPIDPPDGTEGWYYQNTDSSTYQYYYVSFPPEIGSVSPGQKLSAATSSMSAYTVVRFESLTSSQAAPGKYPIIGVYTKPLGDGLDAYPGYFRSRVSYYPSGSRGVSSPYLPNVDYLFYTNIDPEAHPEIPANRRIKMAANNTGLMSGDEDLRYISVSGDNSSIPLNVMEITTRNAGCEFTDRLDEMIFLKSGSV